MGENRHVCSDGYCLDMVYENNFYKSFCAHGIADIRNDKYYYCGGINELSTRTDNYVFEELYTMNT